MTLFDHHATDQKRRNAPLAARMRPRGLEEFVGQAHVVGPDTALRRALEAGHLPSMILWGPPGSGKTTLAHLLASMTSSHLESISAVAAGVADLRRIVSEAGERLGMHGGRTILFVDEIHRFNKAQQDVILPYVEDGTITLIGATTENPSFEVISPLLSRAAVYDLKPLTPEEVQGIIGSALSDPDRGLGRLRVELEPDALDILVDLSNGDARTALNALETAAHSATADESGSRVVTSSIVQEAMQRRVARYDKAGDQHYDTISAFIKSVRSSDPDAAISSALEDARNTRNDPVPVHLRNAVTGLMREMGYGKDYKYAHDFDGHFTPTSNLPDNLKGRKYYRPGDQGHETEVAQRLEEWWGQSGPPQK